MINKTTEIEALVEDLLENVLRDYFEDCFDTNKDRKYAFEVLKCKLEEMSVEDLLDR